MVDGVIVSEEARNKLNNAIENGSLILNYIGHGNEFLWTEEKILDENSIYSWENRVKLPLIITATCEFGKFDDPLITSGGEMLLNKGNGGAIALLTTTRPVFSQTNFRLNNQFYRNVFKKENGNYLRLGDIFKFTKNNSLSGPINRNFSLLGDTIINAYFFSMSIYGWYFWSRKKDEVFINQVSTINRNEIKYLFILAISSLIFIYFVYDYFDKWNNWTAYVDNITTAIFFVAMWLMARRKIESWIFWIIGDLITVPLYFYKGLTISSIQYIIFLILAVLGYVSWKKILDKNQQK